MLIHDGEVYQDVIISQADCEEESGNHQDIVVNITAPPPPGPPVVVTTTTIPIKPGKFGLIDCPGLLWW